ncbi:MAG: type 4a pilus biogenesis protein PilO [Actinobacteria bacterium]|nr:type 4a pilus biogenesis protein PilO [Actinomycetota bacterium]
MKRFVPFIAAGVGVLIVIVWYFALYSPKNNDLSKARSDLSSAQASAQTLRAQLSNLRGLESNRSKQQAVLQKLSAAVPPTPDLATFILQANDIATQSGVNWLQVSPGVPTAAAGGPTTISLTMQLEGGFSQVYDYLNRLENMQRLVLVDSVNLTSKASTSAQPVLSVAVSARMFTRAAAQTGSAGGPATATSTTTPSSTTTSNTKVG